MKCIEIAHDHDLNVLVEMLCEVSSVRDPVSLLGQFGKHFWQIRPVDIMVSISTRNLEPGQYKITRMIYPSRVDASFEPANPWRNWEHIPVRTGGFLGELISHAVPQLLHDLEIDNDPVLGDKLADMGSCIASPIFDHGKTPNWNIYFHHEPDLYTIGQLADHFLTANLVGTATRNLLAINREEELNAKLTAQLEAVARVQQALLPRKIPHIEGLTIATSYLTSDEAGGDYYDFFELPDGRWGIVIADVSGHGAAAATVMAMLHAILHAYEVDPFTPDAVLGYANARLASSRIESFFVTAFFGVYDPATGELVYTRAGHNPPRLKRGDTGRVLAIANAPGLPLGIDPSYVYQTDTITLAHHDTLVLYTDGITEAFNNQREQFGLSRLDGALVGCSGMPDCVVDSIHTKLFEHTRSLDRADDQTIVALQRIDEPSATQSK